MSSQSKVHLMHSCSSITTHLPLQIQFLIYQDHDHNDAENQMMKLYNHRNKPSLQLEHIIAIHLKTILNQEYITLQYVFSIQIQLYKALELAQVFVLERPKRIYIYIYIQIDRQQYVVPFPPPSTSCIGLSRPNSFAGLAVAYSEPDE